MKQSSIRKAGVMLLGVLLLTTMPASAGEFADIIAGPNAISFATNVAHGATLTVTGPDDFVFQERFAAGDQPLMGLFDRAGYPLADGNYTWELRLAPVLSASVRQALAEARATDDDSLAASLRASGTLPREARVDSGYFTLLDGVLVSDAVQEQRAANAKGGTPIANLGGGSPDVTFKGAAGLKDQVILDDLIVDGSACIGFDCVDGESFGFDTLRLKENNLRIKFQDTSASASFPSNDWQLTANDSSNGGANKFSIDDIDGGRTPFTIEASAPSNSLYVDDGGRVGFGTSTPVVELHIVDGDSPTLRLEQDGSSGFTPQTWDVAGNEAGFFVRDTTNGSTLPFRIRPGAASSSIDILGNSNVVFLNGDVGIGTNSPSQQLHVTDNDGGTQLRVSETSTTAAARNIVVMENNGDTQMLLRNTGAGADAWQMANANGNFNISLQGSGATELTIMENGDLVTSGTVNPTSSRDMKEGFSPVDVSDMLARVIALPITEWSYKADASAIRHIGPMAQDFSGVFGYGASDQYFSTTDISGVALAAIQGLSKVIAEKDDAIQRLEDRLQALEKLVLQQ